MSKGVEIFGGGRGAGDDLRVELLGRKGMRLAELAAIGVPVPPGFTVTSEVCRHYIAKQGKFPGTFRAELLRGLAHIEAVTGKMLGAASAPLLVSVRASSPVSTPSLFEGVLNLGMNDEIAEGLADTGAVPSFAWDNYRRLIQGYATGVLGLDHSEFEEALEILKEDRGVVQEPELEASDWRRLAEEYRDLVGRGTGREFPQNGFAQIWSAIAAAFDSTRSERARVYRRLNSIPDDAGIAVVVQAMVFGNFDDRSATGVAFTRNPSTGEKGHFGEYLINSSGEDVVAGIRTPQHLTAAARIDAGAKAPSMEEALPQAFAELVQIFAMLETHFRDMVDTGFCIEQGKPWILSARAGHRTAHAAIAIAVELAREGVISERDALSRVEASALRAQLVDRMDDDAALHPLARGLPASPGAAAGKIVLDADRAERMAAEGDPVILVRVEISPEDVHGMHASKGIVTSRGGMTSHAAVVARGIARPCVSGAASIDIDHAARRVRMGGKVLPEGTMITIDGSSGLIAEGKVIRSTLGVTPEACRLIDMADRLNGACGVLVADRDGALIARALQRTDIYISAIETLDHPRRTGDAPARRGKGSEGFRNNIAEIMEVVGTSRVTVIVDGDRRDFTYGRAGPDRTGRSGIAFNPIAFHETLAEICAGLSAGHADGPGRLRVALSGAMHANDIGNCQAMLRELTDRTSLENIELIGVVDTPYALLFGDRLFSSLTSLLLDMQLIGENLYLQSPEALATYQDLGEIDVPASRGGVFGDVLTLLQTSSLKAWKDRCGGYISAILPSPSDARVWKILQRCGVSTAIYPVGTLPEALMTLRR